MSKRVYIIFGIISILLAVFFITLITSDNSSNDESNRDIEKSDIDKKYSEKQVKMAEKRNDIESDLDEKVQQYIVDTETPKNQEAYNKAIEMRADGDKKQLKRNVKDIINDNNREIEDLSTDLSFTNNKEIEGTYSYTLTYEKNEKTQSESKSGDFVLDTNKDGYFYIKTFN